MFDDEPRKQERRMTLVRRIASASAQLVLSNGLVRLLSLVTMPILTHLLSPTAYGTAAMAETFIALIAVFALAPMDISYARFPLRSHFKLGFTL